MLSTGQEHDDIPQGSTLLKRLYRMRFELEVHVGLKVFLPEPSTAA